MATLYTDLTSANVEEAHNRVSGLLAGGQLRMARATYTLTTGTDETSGDVINLVSLPVGSVVLPHLSWMVHQDLGDEFTIKIGDAADDDRYMASIAVGTNAGIRPFVVIDYDSTVGGDVSAFPAAAFTPYTIAEANRMIKATLGTVTAPTASQKIIFNIVYHAQI